MILTSLDLWHLVGTGDHQVRIADAVNWQLERQPWAVIERPEGVALLELVPHD